jgi:DNA-binding MarR family transcriptional regulator
VAEDHPQLELDRQICFPLYAASRAVTRAYGPLLDEFGLTYPQYLVLLALWGSPGQPMTVGELGHRVQLDTGTLTPLLKRLEAAGHLTRKRDAGDERRVRLEVTDEGWALRERVAGVPMELLGSLELDTDDLTQLRRLLGALLARLE